MDRHVTASPAGASPADLDLLERLARLNVSATSKEGTVTVSLTGPRLAVRLHPEQVVRMAPALLADTVVRVFTGLLRGRSTAEERVWSRHETDAGPPPPATSETARLRAAVAGIDVTAGSDSGEVSVRWRGDGDIRLTIARPVTRPSQVPELEAAIAQALRRANREYAAATRAAFRHHRKETT
ncbi:hypothetical protein LX16_2996 [Stackebrandtia albiflava]|uniref:YbaB/EbfC DNA-binding family protein n=1 Tax=Stackebrandtia albiflava TaxID=406432 RepID=A0A562V2Z8_9ACTN|nr:YbaB/EbfC family nucleoid-associated protein [Stackebrandtia albiflava]TWJ12241.1 hypothetical protein LX16_2996 [Stackebrandtia albiflava]